MTCRTRGSKKAFLFSNKQQQKDNTSSNRNKKLRSRSTIRRKSISDDDSTKCSSTSLSSSLLPIIYPTVQRLTAASPPPKLDGIIAGKQLKKSKLLLKSHRKLSSRSSSNSAQPPPQNRSPYQSKKSQKNLSATLKSCRRSHSNSGTAKNSKYSINDSAWKRTASSDSRRNRINAIMHSNTFTLHGNMVNKDLDKDKDRISSSARSESCSSSSSPLLLPPEVCPANKFVPIGREEDFDDDVSFSSSNYDICRVSEEELAGSNSDVKEDQDWYDCKCYDKYSLPPSPVPTDGTFVDDGGETKQVSSPIDSSCRMDKYCIALEESNTPKDDWFPNVKQEVMRLSSLLASDCGVFAQ